MIKNLQANGIQYSRYIMSWVHMGGKLERRQGISDFENWLKSLGLWDDDIEEILFMAINGEAELEDNAKSFIIKNNLD